LARHLQSILERFLVRAPHECDQRLDHQLHMIQLMRLESAETGRDLYVLRISANSLQVGDDIGELGNGQIRCHLGSIIELAHQVIDWPDSGRQVLRRARILVGGSYLSGCRSLGGNRLTAAGRDGE
jgi:hypothetical protein